MVATSKKISQKTGLDFNIFRERLASVLKQITRTKVERELSIVQAWLQGKKKPKRLYPIYKLLQLTHLDLYWLFGLEQEIDNIEPIEASRVKIKIVTAREYRRIFARAFRTWKRQIYTEPQFKQLIAKRLREYINESNHLELARILEVSPRTITDYWLKARNLPTIDKLFKIAEYFNVSIYTFLPVSGFVVYRLELDNQSSKTETNKIASQTKTLKGSKTDKMDIGASKTDVFIVNVEQDIHCSLTKEDLEAIARQIAKHYSLSENTEPNVSNKNILQRFRDWLNRIFGRKEQS